MVDDERVEQLMQRVSPSPDPLDFVVQGALGAVPYLGAFLQGFASSEKARYNDRIREMAVAVLTGAEGERARDALGDERRARLFGQALGRAGWTDWPVKRLVLAQAVRAALLGRDDELDDGELLVEALMDLDRPHFLLLTRYAHTADPKAKALDQSEQHPSALSGLVRHGALEPASFFDGQPVLDTEHGHFHRITRFGSDLLQLVLSSA